MEGLIICLIVCIIILFLIIVRLLFECRSFRATLDFVLEHLDMAIAGTKQTVNYDESIESAIIEKLNEILAMSQMHCVEANNNQKIIQSLISDIAHQVRTPLTNIMLYSGILEERLLADDNKKIVSQIHAQSKRLDFFMKELVRSSYLETELISVNVQQEEIDKLIAEACQEVELVALKKKIIFHIRECGKKGNFDLKWTKEALTNILDNAIKYSPEHSIITINTIFYENFFCIQITDQGIGIDEQEQGAIFKRFYRSPRVKEKEGLGIGLYLVREIIEKQNGYVKIKSSSDEGSTFFVYLPNNF